jgi:hypothetical protein
LTSLLNAIHLKNIETIYSGALRPDDLRSTQDMHPEITSALAAERQRDLARQTSRRLAGHRISEFSDFTDSGAKGRHLPRYRVSWSRVSLPAIGAAGRRERSFVIVISATRGL